MYLIALFLIWATVLFLPISSIYLRDYPAHCFILPTLHVYASVCLFLSPFYHQLYRKQPDLSLLAISVPRYSLITGLKVLLRHWKAKLYLIILAYRYSGGPDSNDKGYVTYFSLPIMALQIVYAMKNV